MDCPAELQAEFDNWLKLQPASQFALIQALKIIGDLERDVGHLMACQHALHGYDQQRYYINGAQWTLAVASGTPPFTSSIEYGRGAARVPMLPGGAVALAPPQLPPHTSITTFLPSRAPKTVAAFPIPRN